MLIPRRQWTSIVPQVIPPVGLPYFAEPPKELLLIPANDEIIYGYRNPATELHRLLKELPRHESDLDYNYAISQNTAGIYTIRGRLTKTKAEATKILVLIGKREVATDLLKRTVAELQDILNEEPDRPLTPVGINDHNVHVHSLIEYLTFLKLYEGRNDAFYGPHTSRAVQKYKSLKGLPEQGDWTEWCVNRIREETRETIKI